MEIPDELNKSVQFLKYVGPQRAKAFETVGLKTIYDLLFFFPSRYLDRSSVLSSSKVIKYLIDGYEGEVTIIGKVVETELIQRAKKQVFKVTMKDSAGFFECVWFQGIKFFKDRFKENQLYALSAKPAITRYGHLQFVHPDFDFIDDSENLEFRNTGKIISFYRIPKDVRSANLGDLSLRKIMEQAVTENADKIPETLPDNIIKSYSLLGINDSILNLHFPVNKTLLESAQRRFKFEEFFFQQVLIAGRKLNRSKKIKGSSKIIKTSIVKNFLDSLPFQLTESQLSVLSDIRKDMENDSPMNRLIQGDVGSGKTIVALIAMLICVDNGFQAVLMAPTEILADQHFKNICKLLYEFNIKVSLLLGSQNMREKKSALGKIKSGSAQIIIGTHALIQESVSFSKLGLVVIDEQHRFGVFQRKTLTEKGISPDVIVMSATPIPRTLTMTIYGDLDVSVINQMPLNRLPVKTIVRKEDKLPDIYKFISDKTSEGYQSFIVYPLVEESEKSDLKDAETYFGKLKNEAFPDLRVGLIHGKLSWQEKEQVMIDFASKKYDILVSTVVIEVGIDIPDANIIVINDAYRFGLSQLHQLRGRVGRSGKQAYCILISKQNITNNNFDYNFEYLSKSEIEKHKSLIRLNAMVSYNDGFKLAEIDLKLRGPGDIFGLQQSGLPDLKYGNIITDTEELNLAREAAFNIVAEDNTLTKDENKIIKSIIKEKYSNKIQFAKIG